jgi:hypothetical protein
MNNYNNNRGHYSRNEGGYSGNNYGGGQRSNYGGNSSQGNNGQAKKRSGCGMKDEARNGQPCVYGWRYVPGHGLFKFVSSPAKEPATKSERWLKFVTNITRPDGSTFFADTLWDTTKKRLKFTKSGQVANPYASNGGYWGRGGFKMKIRNR